MHSMATRAAAWSAGVGSGRFRKRGLFLLGGCALWVASSPALSADDYLSELDSEAAKVEARGIDPSAGKVEVATPPVGEAAAPVVPVRSIDRVAFEGLLKKHYLGTYRFYKKLPERSREEIFEQYRGGADIGVIRNKIVSRLLQD